VSPPKRRFYWSSKITQICSGDCGISVREEVLHHTIIMGEESLRVVLTQYLAHYHAERNHQGLDNQLIAPASDVGSCSGHVRRRARLGGLLNYYYRDAA
jgi:hypothetical protein